MHLPNVLKKLKLRSKLLIAFFSIGLIPFFIITSVVLNQASKSLSKQAFGQLLSLRDVKKSQVESYLKTMKDQIITLSEDRMIIEAMKALIQDLRHWIRNWELAANSLTNLSCCCASITRTIFCCASIKT